MLKDIPIIQKEGEIWVNCPGIGTGGLDKDDKCRECYFCIQTGTYLGLIEDTKDHFWSVKMIVTTGAKTIKRYNLAGSKNEKDIRKYLANLKMVLGVYKC